MPPKPKKILLHTCCAPCAAGVIPPLLASHYSPTLFWCNPNLSPPTEATHRLKALLTLAKHFSLPVIQDPTPHTTWLQTVSQHTTAPEGGSRCHLCFTLRLHHTAHFATQNSFPTFATTLTLSRHKPLPLLHSLGHSLAQTHSLTFLDQNWRLNSGELKAIHLTKSLKLYRQNYCGCEFSQPQNL